MTSAVSIHDLDLLYIKKTPSKGTRSRDSTQFHRPFTGQSQRHRSVPSAVSGRPAGPTFFNPAAQKCTSPSYPYPLPLSGLAWPSSECLLFSSSPVMKICPRAGSARDMVDTGPSGPVPILLLKVLRFLRIEFLYPFCQNLAKPV